MMDKPKKVTLPSGKTAKILITPQVLLVGSVALAGRDISDPNAQLDMAEAQTIRATVEPRLTRTAPPPEGWTSIHDYTIEDYVALSQAVADLRAEVADNVAPFSKKKAGTSG